MTTYVSSYYEQAPFRGAASFLARSPQVMQRGLPVGGRFTFSIATGLVLATNDMIKLIPGCPAGTMISRFTCTVPGYDGGAALVANVGWASAVNGAGLLSALTTFRGAGTISATDAQILAGTLSAGVASVTTNSQAAGSQDELIIYVTTGSASAGTNGLATAYVELILP